MASIKVVMENASGDKTNESIVTKDGNRYIIEENVYDGDVCEEDYQKEYDEWEIAGSKCDPPVKRDPVLLPNHRDQKRFVFTKLAAVRSYLYQNFYWMVGRSNIESFVAYLYIGDVEIDNTFDSSELDLAEFNTVLDDYLCMFDDVVQE